jgi:hypothetical protein
MSPVWSNSWYLRQKSSISRPSRCSLQAMRSNSITPELKAGVSGGSPIAAKLPLNIVMCHSSRHESGSVRRSQIGQRRDIGGSTSHFKSL